MLIYRTMSSGLPEGKFFVDIDTMGQCSAPSCMNLKAHCHNCMYCGYTVLYPIEAVRCKRPVKRVVHIYRKQHAH